MKKGRTAAALHGIPKIAAHDGPANRNDGSSNSDGTKGALPVDEVEIYPNANAFYVISARRGLGACMRPHAGIARTAGVHKLGGGHGVLDLSLPAVDPSQFGRTTILQATSTAGELYGEFERLWAGEAPRELLLRSELGRLCRREGVDIGLATCSGLGCRGVGARVPGAAPCKPSSMHVSFANSSAGTRTD